MKKLEKLSDCRISQTSFVWGGAQDNNCYTQSENKNMSEAGFCDMVFKIDGTSVSTGPSTGAGGGAIS